MDSSKVQNMMLRHNLRHINHTGGPAYNGSNTTMLDNGMKLINIPKDIDVEEAKRQTQMWLSGLCAVEYPSSLMCNLNCRYCYITDRHMKNKVVSVESLQKIMPLVEEKILRFCPDKQMSHGPDIHISAWGAEPFCNLDTLELLVDYCTRNNFKFGTSTNGTNISDRAIGIARKIFSSGISTSIQVSLDGPEYIQNQNRPYFSGEGSYKHTTQFVRELNKIQKQLHIDHRLYTFCSTIYLEDGVKEKYIDIINFFAHPSSEMFCGATGGRIENHLVYGPKTRDMFVDVVSAGADRIIEIMRETHIPLTDFYAGKIFADTCRCNGYPECSGCNTQIGADIDGSLYICHGPITSPQIKPEFTIGNIFLDVLDYRAIMCGIDYMHCKTLSYGMCAECPVMQHPEATGHLCFSCPPGSISMDGHPSNIDFYRCQAYQRLMPKWIEMNNVRKEYIRDEPHRNAPR